MLLTVNFGGKILGEPLVIFSKAKTENQILNSQNFKENVKIWVFAKKDSHI